MDSQEDRKIYMVELAPKLEKMGEGWTAHAGPGFSAVGRSPLECHQNLESSVYRYVERMIEEVGTLPSSLLSGLDNSIKVHSIEDELVEQSILTFPIAFPSIVRSEVTTTPSLPISTTSHPSVISGPPLKVFISYKRQGTAHNMWVKQLAADLRKNGLDAILDQWEIRLGDSFTDYMTSKIDEADVVLFIMTKQSIAAAEAPAGQGGAVKFEIEMATARRTAGEKMRLVGIYRDGNKPVRHLRDHKYADFRIDSDYEDNLRKLTEDLLGCGGPPAIVV